MNSNKVHVNQVHERQTYYLNDFYHEPEKAPFDTSKNAVIIGRGNRNKERFYFNLNNLNIFFLNFAPPKWAFEFYQKKFPERLKDSIFAFIHGAHIDALKPNLASSVNIITWKKETRFSMFGVKNCIGKCAEWLGMTLKGKDIYLCALDFDEPRPRGAWEMDRDALKGAMQKHGTYPEDGPYLYKNKFKFITPNRYYTADYMPVEKVDACLEKLKNEKLVMEVNDGRCN